MLRVLFLGLCIISNFAFGQSQQDIDSVATLICNAIKIETEQNDSLKLAKSFQNNLPPFLSSYEQDQRMDIITHIYFRLQRNCKSFFDITSKLNPPKGDWRIISEKPKTDLTKSECRQFLSHLKYSYLEDTNDTVNIAIENGYWIDHFKDGTFSKLKIEWTSNCEFEAVFIESNNQIRKYYSIPGDKYQYQIVNKGQGYYSMTVENVGSGIINSFKMYY